MGIANIVFYADDPPGLARFWAEAIGYRAGILQVVTLDELHDAGLDDAAIARRSLALDPGGGLPRLGFRHASGPKQTRNRVHLDLQATPGRRPTLAELDAERDRLVGLGATVVRLIDQNWGPRHELYYQMLDPEGNEFCLQ